MTEFEKIKERLEQCNFYSHTGDKYSNPYGDEEKFWEDIETVLNMLEEARKYIKSNKSRTSYDNMITWKEELFLDNERCKDLLKILGE